MEKGKLHIRIIEKFEEKEMRRASICAILTDSKWSAVSVLLKKENLKLLEQYDFPGEIWLVNPDGIHYKDYTRIFGMHLHGMGEAFMVEHGAIIFSWKSPAELKKWIAGNEGMRLALQK